MGLAKQNALDLIRPHRQRHLYHDPPNKSINQRKATHATSRHLTQDYLLPSCGVIISHSITNRNGCITRDAWSWVHDAVMEEQVRKNWSMKTYVHTGTGFYQKRVVKIKVCRIPLFSPFSIWYKHMCSDPIMGAGATKMIIRKQGENFSRGESHFYAIICFYLAKQVVTVGNKNMCPCAYQKGIEAVYRRRGRKTGEKNGSSRHQNGEHMESLPS